MCSTTSLEAMDDFAEHYSDLSVYLGTFHIDSDGFITHSTENRRAVLLRILRREDQAKTDDR